MKNLFLAAFFAGLTTIVPVLGTHGTASAAPTVKPLIVRIEASWCPACHATQATFDRVKSEYAGKVQFVVLDVSNAQSAQRSAAQAKRLGILDFFDSNKTSTSLVAAIDPRTHAVLGTVYNDTNLADYERLIGSAVRSH